MLHPARKNGLFNKLQEDILALQGFRTSVGASKIDFGLGVMNAAFPNGAFPTGAVHEFISTNAETAAATTGFMAGLLGKLMGDFGICLWIGIKPIVFPAALKIFGIEPHRVIFIDLSKEKDVIWAVEEALKCESLAAVIGELREITFTESRRLQLAVEQSRVTGFIHRNNPRAVNTLACVSRWQITPMTSQIEAGMPGVGHPCWHVELQKIRNGEPGEWEMEWVAGHFEYLEKDIADPTTVYHLLQTG
ncbi:Error-prone repair protein ImuA [Dyadobacter sp. CY261]|uniref:ImuA family protein n=1 Tax=Dyadobacter sp. CY261 TaxID=2907203 RepID=UPI001F434DD2|nr:Error-prone repair protein ImuA [Dyadobacter sp. CY261]MCF0071121.1 Error-prone repair protein ImuA [Dyadobacter sp. CY261]